MIQITLNKIKAAKPCTSCWRNVLRAHEKQGMNTEFPLLSVLDSNDLYDTIWCMRCIPEYEALWRKYGVWCAAQVEHLMTDDRSKNALRVAWRHSDGLATDEELSTARDAARDAAYAARDAAGTAAYAARDAAYAARDAAWAAWAAAAAAATAAEDAAAEDAAAAWATAATAATAAEDAAAARAAAGAAQQEKLVEILTAGEWVGGAPWGGENE